MAFAKVQDRLHSRMGQATFLRAQHLLLAPPDKISVARVACQAIAIVVLLVPVAVAGAAIAVLWATFPGVLGIIIALILLALAYALLPHWPRNDTPTFTAKQCPALFRLLGQIADSLDARVPDGVHIVSEANAYAVEYGLRNRQRIVGIGMPLWAGLTDQEKIALLAHEMAHFVNNDPARGTSTYLALQTVQAWDYFLAQIPVTMGAR